MKIAVDFDGTIVENEYPAIGAEKPHAVKTLKKLASEGDEIILWTVRSGDRLQDAIQWCESHGLGFSAVNSNSHHCVYHQNGFSGSRKILADIFIDDSNIGGFPGWPTVYAAIRRRKRRMERISPTKKEHWGLKAVSKFSFCIWSLLYDRSGSTLTNNTEKRTK